MKPFRICLGCILASFALLVGGAGAQIITEYSAGITAGAGLAKITAGPDGNLWFTEQNLDRIGRITPDGVVTEFGAGITPGARPYGITSGPDGNVWFTERVGNRIGRITPAGVVTEFGVSLVGLGDITAGPDGNVWFTECRPAHYFCSGAIGRITPAGAVTQFSGNLSSTGGITAGPDGNLWFTELFDRIGRITPLGILTQFGVGNPGGAFPVEITAGPDGNLWFVDRLDNRIGRITTDGVVTKFSAGISAGAGLYDITAGPDDNLWFTEGSGNRIGRITADGVVTEFSVGITAGANPVGIAAGPDGNLWFTEPGVNRIGRVTFAAVGAPPLLVSAVSRKTHGAAGVYDLALSSAVTNPTTEPRLGPTHTLVISFDKPLISATVTVTEGIGTASVSTFIANNVVVSLTGVTDQQYVTVSLTNVAASDGGAGGSGSVRIGFLAGDVNQSRAVSVADLGLVNSQLAQPVTMANYLKDVNASGTLTVADKGITNASLTKALPPP